MIRRALLALVLALAVVTVGGSPAQAHTQACAGGGKFDTGVLPLTGTATVGFYFSWHNSCASSAGLSTLQAPGQLTGSCAAATGTALVNDHQAEVVMVQSLLVFTGDAVGTVAITGATSPVAYCGFDSGFWSQGAIAVCPDGC